MKQIIIPDEFQDGQPISIKMAFVYSAIDGVKYFVAFILIAITFNSLMLGILPEMAAKICPLLK